VSFALAAVFACKIPTDLSQPVAIEMILPDSGRVELTDTFRPRAIALNAAGDSVQSDMFWASLDTAVIIVLDSTTGVSVPRILFDSLTNLPRAAGSSGRLQARTATLRSNPQAIQVLARLDSMAADSLTRDTLDVTDSLSDPLRIRTVAYGGTAVNRRVIYSFATYPDSGPLITLLPRDTVTTGGDGKASVQVRVHKGTLSYSVVVIAAMQTLHGDPLPGSPVRFVVEFRP
jgi:hypothetical protein